MPDRRRTITLTVRDEFSSELRRFADQMDKAGGKVTQLSQAASSGGGLKNMLGSLRDMTVVAGGVYMAFNKIVGTAQEWAALGAQAERSEYALRQISDSAEDYASKINAITAATKNTVTEGEAAAMAFQLQQRGIASSADEMERFTRIAAIVGAASPQLRDTSEAINQIALTLSNQSFMRLDQLGVSAGEVRKRMAELKQETKDLSTEEAFQIALMEKLEQQANQVGDAILDVGNQQAQLNTKWREFKEDAGRAFNTALEDIAGTMLDDVLPALEDVLNYLDTLRGMSFGDIVITVTADIGQLEIDLIEAVAAGVRRGFGEDLPPEADWIPASESAFLQQYPTMGALQVASQGQPIGEPTTSGPVTIHGDAVFFDPQFMETLRPGSAPRGMPSYPALDRRVLPGMGAGLPGSIPGDIYHPAPADQGAYANRRAGYDPFGGVFQAGQNIEQFQRAASDTFGALPGFIQEANAGLADMLGAVTRIGDEGELIVTQWDSLNEKFGISASAFDVDVYDAMSEALGAVTIEAEKAAEAQRIFQLGTGMATASSELFESKLADITQKFADGRMSASEYANAVYELSRADFSNLDNAFNWIADTSGLDAAIVFLDKVKESPEAFDTAVDTAGTAVEMLQGFMGGDGKETEGSIFEPMLADANLTVGEIRDAFESGGGEWEAGVANFVDLSKGEFVRMRTDALAEIRAIGGEMDHTFGRTYTITVSGTGSVGGPGGIGPAPAPGGTAPAGLGGFAAGGFTGDGPPGQVAGTVHNREYVVPERGALVVRGGGSNSSSPIEVKLMLDGREIHRANIDVEERQAGVR